MITVTSNVDYNNRVILADSLLLIGLDSYLGPEHRFYQDFQRYIAKRLDAQYLISDAAEEFAKKVANIQVLQEAVFSEQNSKQIVENHKYTFNQLRIANDFSDDKPEATSDI